MATTSEEVDDEISEVKLAFPLVHMNGTGYQNLLDEYLETRRALNNLEEQLRKTTFHQRDYYPVEGSWETAVKAREQFVWKNLNEMREYLDKHIEAIVEQRRK